MSAMLIILLSGLSLFGAILIDPNDGAIEEPADPTPDPQESVEGGTSPLTEATEEPASEPDPSETSEDELIVGTDAPTEPATDEDTIAASTSEADTISGSIQSDTIDAGAGDDVVDGRLGDDTIFGGAGADSISGSEGADVLFGGGQDGLDDASEDTLVGGEGADRLNLGNTDIATGGAGADTFVRLNELTTRALVTDFDRAEDVVIIEHQSDTPPTITNQTIASDGVILELSDGSQIEFSGLTEAIDASLISFVDTRT